MNLVLEGKKHFTYCRCCCRFGFLASVCDMSQDAKSCGGYMSCRVLAATTVMTVHTIRSLVGGSCKASHHSFMHLE